MNRQIVRLTYVALALVGVLVVMTTYWQTWAAAGLADRQDNAIKRVAEFSVDRGLIFSWQPQKAARTKPRASGRATNALLPPLPLPRAGGAPRRVQHRRPVAHGARAVAERLPDRLEREPLDARRQGARRVPRHAGRGRGRRDEPRPGRTAGRARPARDAVRCRRRARSADREGARDGVVAQLRPEPGRDQLRSDRRDRGRLSTRRAASESRERGAVRPRLDVQGDHGLCGTRIRRSSRPSRPSSTPATARSTESA